MKLSTPARWLSTESAMCSSPAIGLTRIDFEVRGCGPCGVPHAFTCFQTICSPAPLRQVFVSNNGVDWPSDSQGLLFSFERSARLLEVEPSMGPSEGGSVVIARGHGFYPSLALGCKIGEAPGRASYISDREIRCITPAGPVGEYPVTISLDKHGSVESEMISFTYVGPLEVASVDQQQLIGATTGGDKFRFRLISDTTRVTWNCRFGLSEPVEAVTEAEIVCTW